MTADSNNISQKCVIFDDMKHSNLLHFLTHIIENKQFILYTVCVRLDVLHICTESIQGDDHCKGNDDVFHFRLLLTLFISWTIPTSSCKRKNAWLQTEMNEQRADSVSANQLLRHSRAVFSEWVLLGSRLHEN